MSLGHLRSLLFTGPLIALLTIGFGTASFVATLFDRSGRSPERLARAWARALLRVSGVRLRTEGFEKIDSRQNYVFVANHRSYMDIPALLASLPVEIRFYAKQGLFLIPFLGTHLKRAGHLPVVRGDARASVKSMTLGARLIQERHVSMLLFPEGGRSRGSMREFKEGAAYIAIKAGVPAVPLGIAGTRDVLPMGSNYVRGGPVILRMGDPIPTAGMKLHDRGQLIALLERQVAELAGESAPQPVETPRPV
ncbi:MAG: 1-acyl-sn-glycerol-3-phosphate acyltransferase [Acidobacteriia bacterium]|nr:1-acyl-sn-glycerol-3-phosphate acyltransferase [Terriglobia bacterium]